MGVLNKASVNVLFHREAVLLGDKDVVPFSAAAWLFGESAVEHAASLNKPFGKTANCYGAGSVQLDYLTYRGFLIAASFHNVQQLCSDTNG